MLNTILADATDGRWCDAWNRLEPIRLDPQFSREFEVLRHAHHIALRLGLDTHRAWTLRGLVRHHPDHAIVHALSVFELVRRGRLFDALDASTSRGAPEPADVESELLTHLSCARVRSALRDFTLAHRAVDAAAALAADDPRVIAERAWTLEDEDRRQDALDLVRTAFERRPDPLLAELECWLVDALGKGDGGGGEVLDLFARRAESIQAPQLRAMIAERSFELGDLARAEAEAKTVLAMRPLGRRFEVAVRSLLMRLARMRGDDVAALEEARAGGRPLRAQAESIANSPGGRRVILPVPFVRQDYVTCSPATMASLLAFHGVQVAQSEIAASITYDGTPDHGELHWATEQGLAIRFFEFDVDTARRLIDLGQPFAISMRSENSGHRVALCGYDATLDSFLLRDPGSSLLREAARSWLVEVTADKGGLCAWIGPPDVADRLPEDLFPHAAECMELVQLRQDLEQRRLADAERRAAALATSQSATIAWEARFAIANEHRDRRAVTRLFAERHEARPTDSYWKDAYAWALGNEGRWREMRSFLEEHCKPRHASPHLLIKLANHIRENALDRPAAEALVRRALRRTFADARSARCLPDVLWHDVTRREQAAELYRVVANLGPFDENLARSCALALTDIGRRDEAQRWLRERVERLGAKSAAPSRTLADILRGDDRLEESIAVLQAACERHPDSEVRIDLFDTLLNAQRLDAAEAVLDEIGERGRPVVMAIAEHRLARARGDLPGALAALERAVEADPSSCEALGRWLWTVHESRGQVAAVAAAESVIAERGDDPRIAIEVLDFFDNIEDRPRAGALLRRIVDEHPREPWLRQRFASHLVITGEAEAALRELAELQATLADDVRTWLDTARAQALAGDRGAAFLAARRALEVAPHSAGGLHFACDYAPDVATARETIEWVMDRWLHEPRAPAADALRTLLRVAADDLEDARIESFLGELDRRFPDDRDLRAARVRFLISRRVDEAVRLAEILRRDFPWDIDLLLLLVQTLNKARRTADARAHLEEWLRHSPASGAAWVELGSGFEEEARLGEAKQAFQRGLERVPGHAGLHGWLAEVQWKLGEHDAALASVARAFELDRDYAWAHDRRVRWLLTLGRHAEAMAVAEAEVAANPAWTVAHLTHAHALGALGRQTERLDALRRALAIDGRLGSARSELVDGLLDLRRIDEARAVVGEGLGILGDDPELLVIEPRILHMQGDLEGGRAALRALLERFPDHVAGWHILLSWLDTEQLNEEIVAIADAPPEALADSAVLLAYAADACFALGRDRDAETHLRRALGLDPSHTWVRQRLCAHLIQTDQAGEVLALTEGGDPSSMPGWAAAVRARAAARTGHPDVAMACFRRLLHIPGLDPTTLREVDAELRRDHAVALRRAVAAVERELTANGDDALVVEENLVHLANGRRQVGRFFARLTRLRRRPLSLAVERAIGRVLYASHGRVPVDRLARWARRHLREGLKDATSFGQMTYALSDRRAAKTVIAIVGDSWRRPDAEGWMLANVAGAYLDVGRLDDVLAVSRHALDVLPHDHASWWHERYLREVALRRGAFRPDPDDRRLPPWEFGAERVRWLAQRLLAELRSRSDRSSPRPVLRERLAELLVGVERAQKARPGSVVPSDLRAWAIVRAHLRPTTLLFALGAPGRRLARRLGLIGARR